jgi:uncharacterized protein YndB with AHSA1/START domain
MKKNEKPIIVEETFPNDIRSVWEAITDPEEMRKWFFDNMPDFKPVVGFKVEFNVESESRDFLHQWKVTRVIPIEIIEYNWKYGGYRGDSFVRFELSKEDGSTRLRLTHTVLEDFDEDVPEFSRESCLTGWKFFIKNRLKDFLN